MSTHVVLFRITFIFCCTQKCDSVLNCLQ